MKLTFPVFDPDLVEEIETYLDQHYQCEVVDTIPYEAVDGVVLRARGLTPDGRMNLNTRNEHNYSRPMIQVLDDNANLLTSGKARAHDACQCYRFDQSWNCPEHPEVPWDAERRQFVLGRLRDLLLGLEDVSVVVDGGLFSSIPAPENIAVREHHGSEDRIVLRYVQEEDRGDR